MQEENFAALEARAKGNTRRIETLEARLSDLAPVVTSVATLDVRIARIEADVQEIKAEVRALAERPEKRWNHLLDAALGALGTAVAAYVLMKLGISVL